MDKFIPYEIVLPETIVEAVLKQARFEYRKEQLEKAIDHSLKIRNEGDFLRLTGELLMLQKEQVVMENI